MSVAERSEIDRPALARVIAGSGVEVSAEDVEAVARSLERIAQAAATLLPGISFDEAGERFDRLLDTGGEG